MTIAQDIEDDRTHLGIMDSEDVTASDVAKEKYSIYAEHVIKNKYPHCVDGLKAIHRRILYVARKDDREVKISSILGRLVEHYHIAGDNSINEAIKRMAQPFNNMIPFMESGGNIGIYGKISQSAAPRYLEIAMSEFAKDAFYRNVDIKTLKFVPSESGDAMEPEYFIPNIPIALLAGTFALGIGYRAVTPSLSLPDLCDLTVAYISANKKMLKSMHKYLVPDFPIENFIRNKNEFIKSYSDTNFEIPTIIDGILEILPNKIVIRNLPFGKEYESNCYFVFNSLLSDKNTFVSKYIQRIGNFSKDKLFGNLEIFLKRGVNPFMILDDIKKVISFSGKFHPSMYYVNTDSKQIKCNHRQLLDRWHDERHRSILTKLKRKQNNLLLENRQLHAILVSIRNSDDIIKIFKNSNSEEDTYKILSSKYGLTALQSHFLAENFNVKKLTKIGQDEVLSRIEKNKTEIKNLQYQYGHVDEEIIENVLYIKNKYSSRYPRRSKFDTFIGYVKYTNGYMQFRNLEEYSSIIKHFRDADIQLCLYPKGAINKYCIQNENVLLDDKINHPKEFVADNFIIAKHKYTHTICLSKKTIYRLNNICYKNNQDIEFVFVNENFITIDKNGIVNWKHYTDIPQRKAIISQGILTNIIHVNNLVDNEGVIIHMNPKEKNILRISKITKGVDKKLSRCPVGKINVLGVYSTRYPIMVSIPSILTERCKNNHLYIKRVTELMTSDDIKLDLRKLPNNITNALNKHFTF